MPQLTTTEQHNLSYLNKRNPYNHRHCYTGADLGLVK